MYRIQLTLLIIFQTQESGDLKRAQKVKNWGTLNPCEVSICFLEDFPVFWV